MRCGTSLVVNPIDTFNAYRPPTLDDLGPPLAADIENISSAVFGHVTWTPPIADNRLNISVGGRYSKDEREIERTVSGVPIDAGSDGSTEYSSFDPSFTLDYYWNDNAHSYLRVATAYRSGGFNMRAATAEPFDKEELIAYELGLKSTWWDQRMRLNVAAFRSEYEDIQLDFVSPIDFSTSTINASDATIDGIELEFALTPVDGLKMGVDYSYLDANREGEVIDPFTQLPLEGTSLPHTPRHKYNANIGYTFIPSKYGTFAAETNYSWHDEQTSNGGPGTADRPRDDFGLLDARLSLYQIPTNFGELSVALWGKNLENKEYQLFSLAGAHVYGEPRSYGIDFIFKAE